MKCVKEKESGIVRRTTNVAAKAMVATGIWNYVPKSEWKNNNTIPRKKVNQS